MSSPSYFHVSLAAHSRSKSHSATAGIAYRAGELIIDETSGEAFDYRKKGGVLRSEGKMHFPAICADLQTTRNAIWSKVEAAEKRKNSTVARDLEVSLPYLLPRAVQIAIAHEYGQFIAERYVCLADVNLHEPTDKNDDRNIHAHIYLSTRSMDADGNFGDKIRILDSAKTGSAELEVMRSKWAEIVNREYEKHGIDERVDHRSYERQGVDLIPTIHVGHGPGAPERVAQNAAIKEMNALNAEEKLLLKERALIAAEDAISEATLQAQIAVADIQNDIERTRGLTPVQIEAVNAGVDIQGGYGPLMFSTQAAWMDYNETSKQERKDISSSHAAFLDAQKIELKSILARQKDIVETLASVATVPEVIPALALTESQIADAKAQIAHDEDEQLAELAVSEAIKNAAVLADVRSDIDVREAFIVSATKALQTAPTRKQVEYAKENVGRVYERISELETAVYDDENSLRDLHFLRFIKKLRLSERIADNKYALEQMYERKEMLLTHSVAVDIRDDLAEGLKKNWPVLDGLKAQAVELEQKIAPYADAIAAHAQIAQSATVPLEAPIVVEIPTGTQESDEALKERTRRVQSGVISMAPSTNIGIVHRQQ